MASLELSELLPKTSIGFDCIVISGDFNIHADNPSNSDTKQFTDLLDSFEFSQHDVGPTHKKGHMLVLVISKGLNIRITSILDVAVSGHFRIFLI